MRLLEHIGEIVDEDVEVQAREPLDFCRLRIFEMDVIDVQSGVFAADQSRSANQSRAAALKSMRSGS